MSNSTEMVTRVARAMQGSKAWPVVFDAGSAQELARVAIAELREPTSDMLDRAMAVQSIRSDRKPSTGDRHFMRHSIYAALSPEDEGSQRK